MTISKDSLMTFLSDALSLGGFRKYGNYFRRSQGSVMQALYLQPSRHGGEYFPEMIISFPDINRSIKNTQLDCHVRGRLQNLMAEKLGVPEVPPEQWCFRYHDPCVTEGNLRVCVDYSISVFFDWLGEYPDASIAVQKLQVWKYGWFVMSHKLYEDLGADVPVLREE